MEYLEAMCNHSGYLHVKVAHPLEKDLLFFFNLPAPLSPFLLPLRTRDHRAVAYRLHHSPSSTTIEWILSREPINPSLSEAKEFEALKSSKENNITTGQNR